MKSYILMILIIFIALLVRIWDVPGVQPGLTWDEASLGYNAYSILKTGRDEYGSLLPLNLKSFGDYKPALYAYITIPFIAIFGLNEFAVRLPSVLSGTGLVLISFLLLLKLFKNKPLAICISFMLAISPYAIFFSRAAFESNLALFVNVLATLFFIKAIKTPRFFIFSAVFFGLSLFTYQASRLFVPLLVIGLFLIYRNQIQLDRFFKVALCTLALFILLAGFLTLGSGQSNRLSVTNYFSYARSEEDIKQISREDGWAKKDLSFQILHGEWFAYTRGLFERYLIYFSPKMLFVDGDYNIRHRVPDLGVLYYLSIFLLPLGLVWLLRFGSKESGVIFLWLLIAPIPAVLSRDLISSLRALNFVLPLSMLEGAGLYWMVITLKRFNKKIFYIGLLLIFLMIFINFSIFLDRLFIHAPREYSKDWLYGYRPMFSQLNTLQNKKNYQKIVITDFYGQPYIYYLFYKRYDPKSFQTQAILDQPNVDVGTVRKIDNIEFRKVDWSADMHLKGSLLIATPDELPDKDSITRLGNNFYGEVIALDGEPLFKIVETSNK